ncbi:hypothetical protein MPSEU_000419200 [Mayamaea pseudoterrestris]|nr:hypothetical protein MPSEU_000419200 [Mayamaea pseudoterrestris]
MAAPSDNQHHGNAAAAAASSDDLIKSLQEQLEEKEEQVFELSFTVTAIETETKHQIETIQQETAQQVRLLQEQLRRTQQEANVARSQAQSLQQRLQQERPNEHDAAAHFPIPPLAVASPADSAPHSSQIITPSTAALPITAWNTSSAVVVNSSSDTNYSLTHILAQTLASTSAASIVPWLLALPINASSHQVCSSLADRFLLHQDMDILAALYYALHHLPADTITVDASRISFQDEQANNTGNNQDLFLRAQRSLLQQDDSAYESLKHTIYKRLVPALLELACTNNQLGCMSLRTLDLILNNIDSNSEQSLAISSMLPSPELVGAFCNAATTWLRLNTSSSTSHGPDLLRQRYSSMHPIHEHHNISKDDIGRGRRNKSTADAANADQSKEQPMDYLLVALPIFATAAKNGWGQVQQLNDGNQQTNDEYETVEPWTRTILAAVLDVLEAVILRRWKRAGDDEDGSLQLVMTEDELINFCGVCVAFFYALSQSHDNMNLLRTQMATTHSTSKEWNRGVSAIAIAVSLLHRIVIQQHDKDYVLDYSLLVWNPVRDALICFFHIVLRWVEVQSIRFAEMDKSLEDSKECVTFSNVLSECLNYFVSAVSLLANVTPSSSVKVDKHVDSMLRLQLAELCADEED